MKLAKFPVTILLLLQYAPLVVIPAFLFNSSARGVIFQVTAAALTASFLVELALLRLGRFHFSSPTFSPAGVLLITVLGLLATELAALRGASSYDTQIASASASPLAALFTPLRPWVTIGATLIIYSWRKGQFTGRQAIGLISVIMLLTVAMSIQAGFLNPIVSLGFAIGFAGILTQTLKARHLVGILLILLLALPSLYEIRNQQRIRQGAHQASLLNAKATDRLRIDKSMGNLTRVDIPLRVGQPGFVDLLRLGLVPRFLDPGRAETQTGALLSVALGQSRTSNTTFTVLGNVYAFSGVNGLYVYCALMALILGLLVRVDGPWGLVASVLLVQACIALTSGYPESIAGLLQGLVSMAAAYALLKVMVFRRARRAPGPLPRRLVDTSRVPA